MTRRIGETGTMGESLAVKDNVLLDFLRHVSRDDTSGLWFEAVTRKDWK